MNFVNSKTIRDISIGIAEKNEISKNAVEELYNYFYKVVVKQNLLSFESHQYSIRYLGTFSLKIDNNSLNYLMTTVDSRLEHYTLLAQDFSEIKPWVIKSRDFYKKTKSALGKVKDNLNLLADKKITIKKERKNYVK